MSQIIHAHVTESVFPSPVKEYRGSTISLLGGFLASHGPRSLVGSRKVSLRSRAIASTWEWRFFKMSKAWLKGGLVIANSASELNSKVLAS